ncbi:KRAB-A domain-containing protein 2-like [Agrilus planipennis]|uniref:KRAB-A domain-containing protein 2-like n=1 Tax=Agrilus planipennis TaxID=224129 RepID=A0A1W4WZV8_AGRPL|nr:KRAB-A domain-containing protein 2-like [Agrilus planipennis]
MDSDNDFRNQLKIRFNEEFSKLVASKGVNSGFMNSEQYKDTIECVKEAKVTTSKTPKQYRRIKRFDIFSVGKVERLITPVSSNHEDFRYYATNEEMFDIIHETHLSIGHGGRQRMVQKINKVYKNITQEIISIYLSLCIPCKMKLKNARKSVVIKPVTHSEVNNQIYSRCQFIKII